MVEFESLKNVAKEILGPYQDRFLLVAKEEFFLNKELSDVKKACEYAVLSGGKRLRPAIVWMVAEAFGRGDVVDLAALASELFHVSSLVVDDLPCMDDDDIRRGIPSTHRAFTETVAVLTSFALTAWGFDALSRVPILFNNGEVVLRTVVAQASGSVGLSGLIGGQWLDLSAKSPTKEEIGEIMDRKTGALFDLCFVLGWAFGGGALSKLDDVRKMSRHFGRAFQLMDDLDDFEKDKASKKQVNFAVQFGFPLTGKEIISQVDLFYSLAEKLGLGKTKLVRFSSVMRSIAKEIC